MSKLQLTLNSNKGNSASETSSSSNEAKNDNNSGDEKNEPLSFNNNNLPEESGQISSLSDDENLTDEEEFSESSYFSLRELLIAILGRESYWKQTILTTDGYELIKKLAQRNIKYLGNDFEHLSILPKIAIEGIINKIQTMNIIDTNGIRGGKYLGFITTLLEEIQSSDFYTREMYEKEIRILNEIINNESIDLEVSKNKVIEIYKSFMSQQSSYADAQYEGAVMAEAFGIHLIIESFNIEGESYHTHLGSNAQDAPVIIINHLQGNRNAHFVLHQVNHELIPHSIEGTGNCLFDSFAQALLELYIQEKWAENISATGLRRVTQKLKGVKLGLIEKSELINDLRNENDLIRQASTEALRDLLEPFREEELQILRELTRYDVFQTVRITAATTLYIKGEENDKKEAQNVILSLINYPGLGVLHLEGADTVRVAAIEPLIYYLRPYGIKIDESSLELLRHLAKDDAFQTVRIAAAKACYLYGTNNDRIEAQDIFQKLLTYNNLETSNPRDSELIKANAANAASILDNPNQEIIDQLKQATKDTSDIVKAAAFQTLAFLGELKNRPWTIAINQQTKAKYATNGEVMLAMELHPYELYKDIAFHHLLLEHQNNPNINFVEFAQRCLAAGTRQYPNKKSVAFLQALEYSWLKYYNLPIAVLKTNFAEEAEDIFNRFSLPGKTIPSLALFDIFLKDFISKNPQGTWRTHKFNDISQWHNKLQLAIANNTDIKQKLAIDTVLHVLVIKLYEVLHAFRDHDVIRQVDFTENEQKFMEAVKASSEEDTIKKKFLGQYEKHDYLHVKSALHESKESILALTCLENICARNTLLPYFQQKYNQDPENLARSWKTHMEKKTTSRERYKEAEEIVSFLIELRNTLIGEPQSARQLLGIAFHGSFFEGKCDSFDDKPAIHLCFTEQFRLAGSILLEYVGYTAREILSREFGTKVHFRVSNSIDLPKKLMCNYVMKKMWTEVITNPTQVNEKISQKLIELVTNELIKLVTNELEVVTKKYTYSQHIIEQHEKLATFLDIDRIPMLVQLKTVLTKLKAGLSFIDLSIEENNILKLYGEYVIYNQMYLCAEIQLLPKINSGLFFPIILKPIEMNHKLCSVELNKIEFEDQPLNFSFKVAHPCDQYCQPASTAYDIIGEIASQFAKKRGFIGTSVPQNQRKETIVDFSDEEIEIIQDILSRIPGYLEERNTICNTLYEAQQNRIDPFAQDSSNMLSLLFKEENEPSDDRKIIGNGDYDAGAL